VALTPPALVEDVGRRRIAAGVRCAFAGDLTRARVLLEETVDITAPGPLRAEAICRLAEVRDGLDGGSIAAKLLFDALAEPGVGRRQRAIILTKLGFFTRDGHGGSGWSRCAQYARAGLELAEELAEAELLVAGLTVLALLEFLRTGRIQRDLLDRAIELSRTPSEPSAGSRQALGDPSSPLTHEPRTNLALQLGIAARYEECRAVWNELIAEQGALDDPNVVWSMLNLAGMEVRAGRWDDAAHVCNEATELNRQMGRELAEPFGLMILGEIDLQRGEAALTSTADLLRAAERLDFAPQTYRLWRVLASLELCRDDPHAAWRRVASLFDGIDEMDAMTAYVAGSVAIEALIGTGDLRTAERLLALLDERAADADMPLRPLAHRCRGLLLSARGDHERAIVELDAAAAAPAPPQEAEPVELGRTLLSLGRVRRRAQHKRAARETLERALEIFERLGARPWADRARSELRRIGGRIASGGELSETERLIVDLVVSGRRNREVANELNLSPNTVAWNLSKIYRKLGVTTRTELAAHVTASHPG
jgi:DNA-binding NarL/FixJ family response regulator